MSSVVDDLLGWIECEEENTVVGAVGSRVDLAQRVGAMTVLMSLAASTIKAQRETIRDYAQDASVDPGSLLEASEQNLKRASTRLTKVELLHSRSAETKRCRECGVKWPCRTVRLVNPGAYALVADDYLA